METNRTEIEIDSRKLNLYEITMRQEMKEKKERLAFASIIGVGPTELDNIFISYKDVAKTLIKEWSRFSFEEKQNKVDDFVTVHMWCMSIAGYYMTPIHHIYATNPDACPTCSGSGLFVVQKIVKKTTQCPTCLGHLHVTRTCKKCEGEGCSTCYNRGYYIYYDKKCETCGVVSPFGILPGNGKVLRQYKINNGTQICKKCQGSGRVGVAK